MKKAAIFLLLVVVLGANALWFYSTLGWDAVDDAYISYVYAQNAILGHGLTFNPSERVEGYSNFLWTAMMVPVVGMGLDVGRVSSWLGVAFGAGVMALAVLFPRRLGIPRIIGWMAALFLAVDGSFALWSVSGLETPMMAFLLTLGAFLYVKENFSPQLARSRATSLGKLGTGTLPQGAGGMLAIPLSGFVFALAAMTRPEAVAVFGLTAAHQIGWRLLRSGSPEGRRTLFTRGDLVRIGSFLLLFVPYWIIRWRYYHALLPNSFYAKVSVGGPIAQIIRGMEHVQQFVGVHLGWLILLPAVIALAVVVVRFVRSKTIAPSEANAAASVRYAFFGFTYFAAVIVFYGAYIIYVGGDWSVGRFFVPMLAFVYLMIAAGLYWVVEFVCKRLVPQSTTAASRAATVVAILLAPVLWYASAYNGEYRIFIGGFDAALATEARETAGKWLRANVPAGTWIAVDAAGQVPYFSGLPAIDMFGINDVHIGRMPVANLGSGTPGHEKFDLGYIIARAPKYVVIYGTLFDSVSEYKRADVQWTDKPELERFLTIYERKADGE